MGNIADAPMPSTEPVLSVKELSVQIGGMTILNRVDFSVQNREILGLIGPNGAGKSTAINVIAGSLAQSSGSVVFQGRELRHESPSRRSRLGLARTFQNLELFSSMTVFENVLCGAEATDPRPAGRGSLKRKLRYEAVAEAISALGLEQVAHQPVGTLSYGTRKLVELGRVFAQRPPFVLLDEPVAGLDRDEKEEFVELFARLAERQNITGILVEHDMPTVRSLCERLVVIDAGNQIAAGPVAETLQEKAVVTAYLGPLALADAG